MVIELCPVRNCFILRCEAPQISPNNPPNMKVLLQIVLTSRMPIIRINKMNKFPFPVFKIY